MTEQIIIGVRGPKGEKIEVLDIENKGLPSDYVVRLVGGEGTLIGEALEKAWTRYKKIKK